MASLAATYHAQGRYDEAEKIKVDVLALRREVLGETHLDTLKSMEYLAETWHAQGYKNKAVNMMEECIQQRRVVLGTDHPSTQGAARKLRAWKREVSGRV